MDVSQLERRAKELFDRANNELDERRRAQFRSLARDLKRQAADLRRPH